MKVEIIAKTEGDIQNLLERAGRVCYRTDTKDAGRFLRARIREGHESIIEHASITFLISDISRACSHQLVRHRVGWSYSQESQRYVDMSDPEFVIPQPVLVDSEAFLTWEDAMYEIVNGYRKLRDLGIRKEDARFLLPNATATTIVATANLRALRNFFRVRCDKAAQWEIRELACEMLRQVYELAPDVFSDMAEEYL